MMFNVEIDIGSVLKGYAVPDAYDRYCNVVIRSEGRDIHIIPATRQRDAPLYPGRHADNRCGFYIDESDLSGLAGLRDLELRDEETGVLFYRRHKPEYVSSKIFRLETHLFPLWRVDKPLNSRFQYGVTGIEKYGMETALQMFLLTSHNSAYISGRVTFQMVRQHIEDRFRVIFIMHHPYEELAERLLVFRQMSESNHGMLPRRDIAYFGPLANFARTLPLSDERALLRALRSMPREVASAVSNPITRQLTCARLDDPPSARAVASALDALASFDVVGLRRASGTFLNAMSELAGLPIETFSLLPMLPGVTALAKILKRSQEFEGLLDLDLQLYAHVAAAYRKAAIGGQVATPRPALADVMDQVRNENVQDA